MILKIMDVEDTVRQFVEPLLKENDIELIKVDFLKSKGKYRLILTVDKFKGNITLDELAEVNNKVGDLLDKEDAIAQSYNLEISSPGVERPLYKADDYRRFTDKMAKVVLIEPVAGQYSVRGKILKVTNEGSIELEVEGKNQVVDFSNIKRGHLVHDIREDLR